LRIEPGAAVLWTGVTMGGEDGGERSARRAPPTRLFFAGDAQRFFRSAFFGATSTAKLT